MCGIVGYVGRQQALEVVVDGLRRLEYRGYDSAGVAVLDTAAPGAGAARRAQGRQAGQPREGAAPSARCRAPSASATPAGRPTARPPTATPTRTSTAPARSRSSTTARSRTTSSSCVGPGAARARAPLRHRHRGRRAPARGALRLGSDRGRPARQPAQRLQDLEGSFVLVVAHRDEPDLVVAARRNLPLVIGLGEGENFVGSDVTAFIAHTREARAVEQDQVVEVRRDGVVVTDLDGVVVDGRELPRRLGHRRRREGRLRVLHAQGDRRAAGGGPRDPRRAADAPRGCCTSTSCR